VVVRTADDISEGTPAVQTRPGQPAKLELIPSGLVAKNAPRARLIQRTSYRQSNGDPDRMPAPVPMQDD